MKKLIYTILILAALVTTSCERLMMPKSKSDKRIAISEELWKTSDEGSALFDLKGVRWDSIHSIYQFSFTDTMTERQLFDTCALMLSTLRDRNVTLYAGFATAYYPAPTNYRANFNKSIMERRYWAGHENTGPFIYKVIDSVGYIYYGNFDDDVTDAQIDAVIERLTYLGGKKGIILDVRNSVGTRTDNMFTIFRHMTLDSAGYDFTSYLYQTQYKKGPAHDDFTDYQGSWMDKNDTKKFNRHIRVLTNRAMWGVANLFATGSKGFIPVKTMGDTTGGGGGIPSSKELANGWVVTFTSCRIRTSEGIDIENGVAPDTTVHMQPADEAAGKDTILEAALYDLLHH